MSNIQDSFGVTPQNSGPSILSALFGGTGGAAAAVANSTAGSTVSPAQALLGGGQTQSEPQIQPAAPAAPVASPNPFAAVGSAFSGLFGRSAAPPTALPTTPAAAGAQAAQPGGAMADPLGGPGGLVGAMNSLHMAITGAPSPGYMQYVKDQRDLQGLAIQNQQAQQATLRTAQENATVEGNAASQRLLASNAGVELPANTLATPGMVTAGLRQSAGLGNPFAYFALPKPDQDAIAPQFFGAAPDVAKVLNTFAGQAQNTAQSADQRAAVYAQTAQALQNYGVSPVDVPKLIGDGTDQGTKTAAAQVGGVVRQLQAAVTAHAQETAGAAQYMVPQNDAQQRVVSAAMPAMQVLGTQLKALVGMVNPRDGTVAADLGPVARGERSGADEQQQKDMALTGDESKLLSAKVANDSTLAALTAKNPDGSWANNDATIATQAVDTMGRSLSGRTATVGGTQVYEAQRSQLDAIGGIAKKAIDAGSMTDQQRMDMISLFTRLGPQLNGEANVSIIPKMVKAGATGTEMSTLLGDAQSGANNPDVMAAYGKGHQALMDAYNKTQGQGGLMTVRTQIASDGSRQPVQPTDTTQSLVRGAATIAQQGAGGGPPPPPAGGASAAATGATPAPSAPPTATGAPVAIGDSIANGVGSQFGQDARNASLSRVGAPPGEVLQKIQNGPDLTGRPVVLSTGTSNLQANGRWNGSAFTQGGAQLVDQQIKAAVAKGANPANITVLGVGPNGGGDYANGLLGQIAQRNGAKFQPIGQTGADGVHPASYGALAGSIGVGGKGASGAPAAATGPGYNPTAQLSPNVAQIISGPESGGSYTIRNTSYDKNPDTQASGRYQMLGSTWRGLAAGDPEASQYRTAAQAPPAVQDRMAQKLVAQNNAALQARGVPLNDATAYSAWAVGAGDAAKLYTADPNASVASIGMRSPLRANPSYFLNANGTPKTAGQARDAIAAALTRHGGNGGAPPQPSQPAAPAPNTGGMDMGAIAPGTQPLGGNPPVAPPPVAPSYQPNAPMSPTNPVGQPVPAAPIAPTAPGGPAAAAPPHPILDRIGAVMGGANQFVPGSTYLRAAAHMLSQGQLSLADFDQARQEVIARDAYVAQQHPGFNAAGEMLGAGATSMVGGEAVGGANLATRMGMQAGIGGANAAVQANNQGRTATPGEIVGGAAVNSIGGVIPGGKPSAGEIAGTEAAAGATEGGSNALEQAVAGRHSEAVDLRRAAEAVNSGAPVAAGNGGAQFARGVASELQDATINFPREVSRTVDTAANDVASLAAKANAPNANFRQVAATLYSKFQGLDDDVASARAAGDNQTADGLMAVRDVARQAWARSIAMALGSNQAQEAVSALQASDKAFSQVFTATGRGTSNANALLGTVAQSAAEDDAKTSVGAFAANTLKAAAGGAPANVAKANQVMSALSDIVKNDPEAATQAKTEVLGAVLKDAKTPQQAAASLSSFVNGYGKDAVGSLFSPGEIANITHTAADAARPEGLVSSMLKHVVGRSDVANITSGDLLAGAIMGAVHGVAHGSTEGVLALGGYTGARLLARKVISSMSPNPKSYLELAQAAAARSPSMAQAAGTGASGAAAAGARALAAPAAPANGSDLDRATSAANAYLRPGAPAGTY